ncbi:MAG: HAMP domain-containing protein [Spartobacteria bacterium]|nr:HAMP domain-containing protein [Spartobacteria bacterium]
MKLMFDNLKGLIALLIVAVLLITAVGFMIFTRQEVTHAMLKAGEESARNVLRVVKLNIADEYRNLEAFRAYALARYEDQLRNVTALVVDHIECIRQQAEEAGTPLPAAQELALRSVEKMRYGHDDYFYIYNTNNIAIGHPFDDVRGKDLSGYHDARGQLVMPIIWETLRMQEDGFLTILWRRLNEDEPVPKLLYFRKIPAWNWMIGTGVYIDDIESDARRKMDEIMAMLRESFSKIDIAKTGYYWLFNGDGEILIHPALAAGDTAEAQFDIEKSKALLEALKQAARHPEDPLVYLWNREDDSEHYTHTKYAYVEYFEPLDWYIVASIFKSEMELPARIILRRQGLFVLVTVVLCILVAVFLVTHVTRPLAHLTAYAAELQAHNFAMPQEKSQELLAITFPREVGRLAGTIWSMERRLAEYVREIRETTAARERMQSELRIAHDIQMSMLPPRMSEEEQDPRLRLSAFLKPAKDVGGDLYDFFYISDDKICLAVGDVSDKGIPASLFMARSIALLRATASAGLSPCDVMRIVNKELCVGNDICMFVTVFLGLLDLTTGTLTYSNAAHCRPYVVGPADARGLALPKGMPVGVDEDAVFSCMETVLKPGETLLVFTDGVTEAMNTDNVLFGDEGVEQALAALGPAPESDAVLDAVVKAVDAFVMEAPQSDDITLLAATYKG